MLAESGEREIPFSAIDGFARRAGINDPDEFNRFKQTIRLMDAEFLRIRQWKDEQERANRAKGIKTLVASDDVSAVKDILGRLGKPQAE